MPGLLAGSPDSPLGRTTSTAPAPEAFAPSAHQRAIFDFVRSGQGHAVVRATAGSGKTTTLVEVARRLPPDLEVCFLAFARDAAGELRERLGGGVDARTVHSAGRRALAGYLRRRGRRLVLTEGKYRDLARAQLGTLGRAHAVEKEELLEIEEYLLELLEFARLNLTQTRDREALRALAERYSLAPPAEEELEDEVYDRVPRILRNGLRLALHGGVADFTDLLYVPFVCRNRHPAMRPRRYDVVCVDEAQDYSALALELTMLMVKPGGRMLFVGDPRQSIYGFAGADTDALDRIIAKTGATVLPLSVTYRCPASHVELAQRVAPELEPAPGATRGSVRVIEEGQLGAWAEPGTLVLCRNNAPLVQACLELVRGGRRAFVRGRDLAREVLRITGRVFEGDDFEAYPARLAGYVEREGARLERRFGDGELTERLLARTEDLVRSVAYLVEELGRRGAPSLARLERLVGETFGEDDAAVALSTVHRAKGREADRVLLLYPELMPAVYAKTPEAVRGEECVLFVALTRAKRELVFVRAPPREDHGAQGEIEKVLESARAAG